MLRNVAVTSTLYLQQEKEQLALIQILARYAIAQIIHHLLHDYFFSTSAITYICIKVSFREEIGNSVVIIRHQQRRTFYDTQLGFHVTVKFKLNRI